MLVSGLYLASRGVHGASIASGGAVELLGGSMGVAGKGALANVLQGSSYECALHICTII